MLERIKKTPNDMPNVDMPIGRAYEIAQLPKNLIERNYNVNGKSKPIYKMNIKQIKILKNMYKLIRVWDINPREIASK